MKLTNRGSDFLLSSLVCIIPILVLGVGLPQVFANEFYGISLDNTCKTYLKNNLTTTCPTYEDIITLFPDTSNRKISGEFGYFHGIFQRLPTKIHNSFEYYRTVAGPVLFIDPPDDQRSRLKMIEIKANLKEYKLPGAGGSFSNSDYSLIMGHGRYIDKHCTQASIDAREWIYLVGDSIPFLKSNCDPAATNYNSTTKTYLDKVTHDITTSYKWKLEQWQKESLLKCGSKVCIYDRNQSTPP